MNLMPSGMKSQSDFILVFGLILIVSGFGLLATINDKRIGIGSIIFGVILIILSLFWIRIKHDIEKWLGFRPTVKIIRF